MTLARVLDTPVPILAAALEVPTMSDGPAWLMGFVAGVWLLIMVLEKFGKLPAKNGERAYVANLHQLLATEDNDGRPRVLRHFDEIRELGQVTKDFRRLAQESNRLTSLVTEQLCIQNERLGRLETTVSQLKKNYEDLAAE